MIDITFPVLVYQTQFDWIINIRILLDYNVKTFYTKSDYLFKLGQQPYPPVARDWLPTKAKQGWAWSVPGWETSWETRLLLEEVLVRPVGGAHPAVCVGPNAPV